jgi:outer membrane autotransporter protein
MNGGGHTSVHLGDGAQLVGRTVLSVEDVEHETGYVALLTVSRAAAAIGDVRVGKRGRGEICLFAGGRFEGRVTGSVTLTLGPESVMTLLGSVPRVRWLSLGGRLQFARNAAPEQAITASHFEGEKGSRLVLRTLANSGGPLAAQKTDRLLIAGRAQGGTLIDVEMTGTGEVTDTNSDYVNQSNEGISLVQVAGYSTEKTFLLSSGYVAVGPYRYELVAFGPGKSDEAQRLVQREQDWEYTEDMEETEGFWDYRLMSLGAAPPPKPEPVVVPPAPPEPVVIEPPPLEPVPVVVEPPPSPKPEPVVTAPPPPPKPEPVIIGPLPLVPEPVVVEPQHPEPVVAVPPPPPPAPAPEIAQPEPAPKPAPSPPKPAATPQQRVLVPQASAYVAMPLAASGFLSEALHSWGHPHSNPVDPTRPASRESERGFVHMFGSRGRYQASGHERAYRPDFSTRQYGAQFGLPVHRYHTANGITQIDLGASAGDAGFTIDAPRSQSHSRIRIAGLGLRIGHTHSSGAYARGLLKIDHLGIDVRTPERNEVAAFGGLGVSALGEVGGAATFANGWTVESSMHASYIEVRLRNFIDADRVSVKPQPFRSASTGVAGRVSRSFTAAGVAVRPYVGAGLAYTSGPPSSQRIGGVSFASETMSSSWEASAGFEGTFGKNARLLVDVAVQDGFDHGFSSVFASGAVHWAF